MGDVDPLRLRVPLERHQDHRRHPAGEYTRAAGCSTTASLTVSGPEVHVDLVVDNIAPADEQTVGAFIARNDDVDEDNQNPTGTPVGDNQPHDPDGSAGPVVPVHRIVATDNELVPAQANITGTGPAHWTMTFSSRVKV